MIHYIPIENIEQRYTKLMNEILYPFVDFIYYPEWDDNNGIVKGEFLDIEKTIEFKSKQLTLISKAFQSEKVKDGDWFLFGDLYFQGIESIKYMAELQDIKVYIAGFNYAGRADKNDFVQKLGQWSDYSEKAYHEAADLIFVGSEYHKENIVSYFSVDESKVKVTGYIWDAERAFKLYPLLRQKEDFVIFPHRLSKEKGLDDFFEIAKAMPEKRFVVTSSSKVKKNINFPSNIDYVYGLTKQEYYSYLSKAKYYLSTAYQETFGYTLREALLYNCIIAVPNRVCYPEMVKKDALYNSIDEVKTIFNNEILMPDSIKYKYSNNVKNVINLLTDAR